MGPRGTEVPTTNKAVFVVGTSVPLGPRFWEPHIRSGLQPIAVTALRGSRVAPVFRRPAVGRADADVGVRGRLRGLITVHVASRLAGIFGARNLHLAGAGRNVRRGGAKRASGHQLGAAP